MKNQSSNSKLPSSDNEYLQKINALISSTTNSDLQDNKPVQPAMPYEGSYAFALPAHGRDANPADYKGGYIIPLQAIYAAIEHIDKNNEKGSRVDFSIGELCNPIDARFGGKSNARSVLLFGEDILNCINERVCEENEGAHQLGSYIINNIELCISDDIPNAPNIVSFADPDDHKKLGLLALQFVSQNAIESEHDDLVGLSEDDCEKLGSMAIEFTRKHSVPSVYGIKHATTFTHLAAMTPEEYMAAKALDQEGEFLSKIRGWRAVDKAIQISYDQPVIYDFADIKGIDANSFADENSKESANRM